MSYFGRVNYNYKEKYLIEANARYDGSSKFQPPTDGTSFTECREDGESLRNLLWKA